MRKLLAKVALLTGYIKATSAQDIAPTDDVTTALGKLEYKVDNAQSADVIPNKTEPFTGSALNFKLARRQTRMLTGNLSITITNPVAGEAILLEIDSTAAGYTFTMPASVQVLNQESFKVTKKNLIYLHCVSTEPLLYRAAINT